MYIGRISKFVAYFYPAVWPKQVLNNNQLIINYEQSTNWIDVDNEQSGHGKNIAWWIMNCLGVELSRSSQLVPKILTTYINLQQTYDLITNFSILKSLESLRHRDQVALILKDLHIWSFLFYFLPQINNWDFSTLIIPCREMTLFVNRFDIVNYGSSASSGFKALRQ